MRRGGTQLGQKLPVRLEVVRWVVREDQQVLGLGMLEALCEDVETLLSPRVRISKAIHRARRPLAILELLLIHRPRSVPAAHVLVHVHADHLQIEVLVLDHVVVAGHVEVVQILDLVVDLRALVRIRGASARVVVVVMVAVDAVPGNAAELGGVHVPPLRVPLGIVLALDTLRVERVPNIDDELDVAELLEFLQHPVTDAPLARRVGCCRADFRPSPNRR
mmetsp:Transcript_14741/g.40472  ORF Transcript_14741/g.40472 Transcript_14741/m.40472 type:complete len:220 (+) Transcript_14741:258-917(+)